MMRSLSIIILVLMVIGLIGGFEYLYKHGQTITPAPIPTQTSAGNQEKIPETTSFCTPGDLDAGVVIDVAAGNAYGTITIKNISNSPCQIVGSNTLEIGYPNSVQNFKTTNKGAPSTPVFILIPGKTIYSLLHFPNGPQCSSKATDVNAAISYKISPTDSVTFKPTMGPTVSIPSCGSDKDITIIDLYPFSTKEVLPQ